MIQDSGQVLLFDIWKSVMVFVVGLIPEVVGFC